jgi:hypothetical protein
MEDNHCVIMEIYPRNQLISRIHMTSKKKIPLTLNPAKNKNTSLVFGKANNAQLDIAFTI